MKKTECDRVDLWVIISADNNLNEGENTTGPKIQAHIPGLYTNFTIHLSCRKSACPALLVP